MNSTDSGASGVNLPAIVALLIVSVCVVGLNTISIFVFLKSKITPSMKLMFGHLSALSLMVGLHAVVVSIPSGLLNYFPYDDIWVQILGFFHLVACVLSLYNVMFIVVDRYLLVCHHAKYKVWVTPCRVLFIIISSWLFWLTSVSLVFISTPKAFHYEPRLLMCLLQFSSSLFPINMLLGPVLTTCVVAFCYTRIIWSVLRLNRVGTEQARRLQVNRLDARNSTSMDRKRKSAIFVSLLLSLYVVPLIPFLIAIPTLGRNKEILSQAQWFTVVLYVGCFLNVFVYIFGYLPFRKAFMDIFCKSYVLKQKRKEMLAKVFQVEAAAQ